MSVYNQPDLIAYIQDNTPKVSDLKVYVIINDVGEVLDIGQRHGIFTSKSGAVQALNRFIGNKIKWYEYNRSIPLAQRLYGSAFTDEIRDTIDFLLSNKLIIIEKMVT